MKGHDRILVIGLVIFLTLIPAYFLFIIPKALSYEEFVCGEQTESQTDVRVSEMNDPIIGYVTFFKKWYVFERGAIALDRDVPQYFEKYSSKGWRFVKRIAGGEVEVLVVEPYRHPDVSNLFQKVRSAPLCIGITERYPDKVVEKETSSKRFLKAMFNRTWLFVFVHSHFFKFGILKTVTHHFSHSK